MNPGTFNPAVLVHGEQAIELHGEIPVEGTVSTTARITAMYDKGSAAVVVSEATSVDVATGKPLIMSRNSMFIRGEGGWGGDRGPSGPTNVAPDRDPDHVVTYDTRPTRRSPTGCRATATRCTPIPSSPRSAGFPEADPPRSLHVRVHRPRAAALAVRLRPRQVQEHGSAASRSPCSRVTRSR